MFIDAISMSIRPPADRGTHNPRLRLGLVAFSCLIGLALPAAAQNQALGAANARYLALGDSLTFGFNPFVNPPDASKYIGFPDLLTTALRLQLSNASCPGETSDSFVHTSGALPGFTCGLNPTATVFGANGSAEVPISLLVPYNGAPSQLEYARRYLTSNPNTRFVTINIGGNDLAPLQICAPDCEPALVAALINNLVNNLVAIYSTIRGTGYQGPIIAVNYYAFNFKDPLQVGPNGAFSALNKVIADVSTQFGARVADVFTVFQALSGRSGDPCAAGLLLKPTKTSAVCDTHPSILGQALIAGAVASRLVH